MKSKKSIYLIVTISLFVGLLHFVTGPAYQGPFKQFMQGYLIDLLLPLNLYLLLQLSLRKKLSVLHSRVIAAVATFSFGVFVELLQLNNIHLFGSTYVPLDIFMYGAGVGLGLLLDLTIISRFEKLEK
jgi:hypothetical protein